MTVHALTVDLEDWHQLLYRRFAGRLTPPSAAVDRDTRRLLDLLDAAGVRATFFVLGIVAAGRPDLVREVARRGHEIASHSYSHELIFRQTPEGFRADLDRSRKQLQDLTGQPVLGFRAPEFSVGRLDHWCFEVLADLGFRYDSSVFPIRGARYGIPTAPRRPFAIGTPSGPIQEYPLATWDAAGRRLPVAGGTYFRLLPAALLRRALVALDRRGCPAVLYFHPYEFHRGLLYLSHLSARARLHAGNIKLTLLHNLVTGQIERRLRPLLARFQFRPLGEWSVIP